MRGEFICVWPETWRDIWSPLVGLDKAPDDVVCEMYRELLPALKVQPSVEILADNVDDPVLCRETFAEIRSDEIRGEQALIAFLEAAHPILEDMGGDLLSNHYFNLLDGFIGKFSLRYDLRRPCTICPTVPGVFASLVRNLREFAKSDTHLDCLMKEYEAAVRDLRLDRSEGRIKTCIQKQVNLLEAIGRFNPGVVKKTLGAICDELGTWPHDEVRDAMKSLYSFASDYPGIRHGGTPANRRRDLDMRDLVAMSALLVGFTPYLSKQMQCDLIYQGS